MPLFTTHKPCHISSHITSSIHPINLLFLSAHGNSVGERDREQMMGKERVGEEEPKDCFEVIGKEEEAQWPRKGRKKGAAAAVMLEGYIAGGGGEPWVGRTKSLTNEDLEELKGCLDLGFSFSYEEIPELCGTLPALELCYSMSQRFPDDQLHRSIAGGHAGGEASPVSPPRIANWKISSPGDHPDEVKARLKYWAQTVACTARLCS